MLQLSVSTSMIKTVTYDTHNVASILQILAFSLVSNQGLQFIQEIMGYLIIFTIQLFILGCTVFVNSTVFCVRNSSILCLHILDMSTTTRMGCTADLVSGTHNGPHSLYGGEISLYIKCVQF